MVLEKEPYACRVSLLFWHMGAHCTVQCGYTESQAMKMPGMCFKAPITKFIEILKVYDFLPNI